MRGSSGTLCSRVPEVEVEGFVVSHGQLVGDGVAFVDVQLVCCSPPGETSIPRPACNSHRPDTSP